MEAWLKDGGHVDAAYDGVLSGATLLMLASESGRVSLVELLLRSLKLHSWFVTLMLYLCTVLMVLPDIIRIIKHGPEPAVLAELRFALPCALSFLFILVFVTPSIFELFNAVVCIAGCDTQNDEKLEEAKRAASEPASMAALEAVMAQRGAVNLGTIRRHESWKGNARRSVPLV